MMMIAHVLLVGFVACGVVAVLAVGALAVRAWRLKREDEKRFAMDPVRRYRL